MADYISNYSGTEIDSWGGRIAALESPTVTSQTVVESGSGLTANFKKCGRLVQMTITAGSLSAAVSAGATLITIPSGYIPIMTFEMEDVYNSTPYRIQASTSGIIRCTGAIPASTNLRCSGTWISAS